MLAQMTGAEIFVTVGSVEKAQFLMTQYGIPEGHIPYNRDTSFGRAFAVQQTMGAWMSF